MNIKFCTWNIKGSNNAIKRKAVLNCLRRDNVQIAFLQETHLNDVEHKKYLREWVGQVHFSSYSTNKRGVIILVHKKLPFTVKDCYKDIEGRVVLIKGELYGEAVLLGSIYAPNVYDEEFFASLLSKIADMDCPNMLIGGDFNCSLFPIDRNPAHNNQSKTASVILDMIDTFDLLDSWRYMNPDTKSYTFYSHPHLSSSRIDYIFLSKHLANLVEQSDIGSIALSDHAPVTLIMQPLRPAEHSFSWRLNSLLFYDDDFIKFLENQTDFYLEFNDNNDSDPRIIWEAFKAYMRGMIISYSSRKKKERIQEQLEIEKRIKKLEEDFYRLKSDDVLKELKEVRSKLTDLITRKAESDILFARQRMFEFGNKPNKLLARLARNSPSKSFISAIHDQDDQRQTNNLKINECFKKFYEKLYSSEMDTDKLSHGHFLNKLVMPQLSDERAKLLEGPITLIEIDKAISSLQSGKSPGADGFCVEFYKTLKGKINKLLLRVFNKSFEEGELPESMYDAHIIVIPKKDKNPEQCSSYRPISLLGVDMKILSKIVANRLERVVTDIVNADQTGFIKGRTSSNNTRRLINIVHYLNSQQIPGAIVSMDAEKAFDRIEREYMLEVLRRFGFQSDFIGWIQLLYKTPMASVMTNGLISDRFELNRGTAQGSPLSPLLFSLAIEPLAIAVRQTPSIKGTVIGTTQHKILLYADDILLTVTDPIKSIPALINCVTEFGQISGYKVNFTKSEIMPLATLGDYEPNFVKPFKWAPDGLTYLGVKITPKLSQLYVENVSPLIRHIKDKMTGWMKLPISFLGRINLIKMTILPKITYPISMLFLILKRDHIEEINKAMSDFVWNGRKPKIKLDVLQLPKEQGGWGLPNIAQYVLSMQARIISVWAGRQPKPPWYEIEEAFCKPFSPINLLDKRRPELPVRAKDNFVITNVIKSWNSLKKLFGSKHTLCCLKSLVNNPDLTGEGTGANFKKWEELGIHCIFDLWDNGNFKSFETIKGQYNLPKNDFYKYLQIRHYVHSKMNTLSLPTDFCLLEKTLLDSQKHSHFVSKFYSTLQRLTKDRLSFLRTSWNTLLKTTIDLEAWEDILLLPSKISICNRYKEMQYNILHNVYISPYMYSKYTTGASPNCLKCKTFRGTTLHCLWECEEIQRFWKVVCTEVSVVIGQQLKPSALLCLLGLIPDSLKLHKHTVHFLFMVARKAIMTKWVGDEPPSSQLWKSIISDTVSLERLRFRINGQYHLFKEKFDVVLKCLKIRGKMS